MKKIKYLTVLLTTALCLALLGGFGSSAETTTETEEGSYWENQTYDELTGSDFVVVGESGDMQLLVNPSTAVIRWLDTSTGVYHDSNMLYDEADMTMSNAMRSDVTVTYFSGSSDNGLLYSATSSYDSYSMSTSRDQVEYQLLDNGVRIVYTLGDDSITAEWFPLTISNDRMQEYVIQYLTASEYETLQSRYTYLSSDDAWHRAFNTNSLNSLNSRGLSAMYTMFYETGAYTLDLLYEDLDTWDADEDQYPSNLNITLAIEYYLEDDGELVVRIDTSKIETEEDNPINKLTLLPYFITSDASNDEEEGYIFIPDNSGALIYLDSTKTREYHYSASFYDGDQLVSASSYSSTDNLMTLPVFGMKTSETTIFAVIEEGAEIARLDAYVSYTDNSEPFSKVKLTFEVQAQQASSAGTGSAGSYTVYKASDDVYEGYITVRYFWLGEEATYVDMAECYSDYLVETGVLTAEEDEEDAPLYVEVLGATDKTQYMLGIPYDGKEILTTFSQAREILVDLTEEGISNIKLIYSGMVNGGMNQRSVSSGLSFVSGLGGSSAWKSLLSYAESVGAQVFPNLQLQTAYTKTNLSNDTVAWTITKQRAEIYSFDLVTHAADDEADLPLYIISPTALSTYLSKAKTSISNKLGVTTVASSDLYTFVPTNYKDTQVSMSSGAEILDEVTETFADGLTLMLSNPLVNGYAYASYLTDIPTSDSGMRVLDASVPFIQLVLDGYKTYSTESLNLESTDVYENFMNALEGNAVPKFTFIYSDSTSLSGTLQEDYFAVEYSYWKDKIGAYYEEYCTFYDAVKGATIVDHELYERDENLRIVTYSNGVKVYFNYSDEDAVIDGVTVSALSYVIE